MADPGRRERRLALDAPGCERAHRGLLDGVPNGSGLILGVRPADTESGTQRPANPGNARCAGSFE